MTTPSDKTTELLEAVKLLTGFTPKAINELRWTHLKNGGGIPTEITLPMDVIFQGMRITLAPVLLPTTRSGLRSITHHNVLKEKEA